jgi:hypothetical protein
MTVDELKEHLPDEFLRAVQQSVEDNIELFLMHHGGFQTDNEMSLLGMMVKYACMRGLHVRVIAGH